MEEFNLYGVKNKKTGKLVSNITNPRHKYWESKKRAQNAIEGYTASHCFNKGTYNKEDLEVVEIHCKID